MYHDSNKRSCLISVSNTFKDFCIRCRKHCVFIMSLEILCLCRLSIWFNVDQIFPVWFVFVVLVTDQLARCRASEDHLDNGDESGILSQAQTCYVIF